MMDRYDIIYSELSICDCKIKQNIDGEYVKYSDVQADKESLMRALENKSNEIEILEAENAKMKALIEEIIKTIRR